MAPLNDSLVWALAHILAEDTDQDRASQLLSNVVSANRTQLDISTTDPAADSELVQRWSQELHRLLREGHVAMVPRHATDYPDLLGSIENAPPLLFARGDVARLRGDTIAVVGSRLIDSTIRDDTFQLCKTLASAGYTIVSGLALGTDTAAHRGALLSGTGRTVAVLPSGITRPFPTANTDLLEDVSRVGVAVSQFMPWDAPVRESFLTRNATISGLSSVSVVMAAQERSGTRNEIGHALAQGRPVLLWKTGVGDARWANDLVSLGKAKFVRSAADVRDAVEEARGA